VTCMAYSLASKGTLEVKRCRFLFVYCCRFSSFFVYYAYHEIGKWFNNYVVI
jgi:hypothetical protein